MVLVRNWRAELAKTPSPVDARRSRRTGEPRRIIQLEAGSMIVALPLVEVPAQAPSIP